LKAGYVYDLKMGELQTSDGKLLMNRAVFYTLNQLKK
jgi:hypothetical protein